MNKLLISAFVLGLACTGQAVAQSPATPAPSPLPSTAATAPAPNGSSEPAPAPAAPTPGADTAARIDQLQRQLDQIKAALDELKAQNPSAASAAGAAKGPTTTDIFGRPVDAQGRTVDFQPPKPSPPPAVLTLGKGPGINFVTPGGSVSLYGNLDLSYDITTKGLAQHYYPYTKDTPVGNVGYLSGISTNLSYFGVRGSQKVAKYSFVYQLETQLDISSTAGTVNTNSNNDTVVKGALTSRNSFIGFGNNHVGTLKIGKTDAPYKTSTAKFNPFSGELGDYSVIMANSGGDNRVEFGTRLDHSLWYESPVFNGFSANFLVSPGQNRGYDDSQIAAGESSCAGGNAPGSGALPPTCNDGAYGTAYSGSLQYQIGKLYLTTAAEVHKGVNRTSDLADLDPRDIGDERAIKGGIQYSFSKATTIGAIYEDMARYIPADLQYQNERTRNGFWLEGTQYLNNKDNLNFGWARANPSPGDPGQHNTPGGANPDNMANMYTFAFKHPLNAQLLFYVDWALTVNHADAHYDLGAGGRGLTTDCHDGSTLAAYDPTTGTVTGDGPHCYAGGRLQGFSTGLDFRF